MNKFIIYRKSDGVFWFRVCGVGLHFIDRSKHSALFSERYGYTKVLRVGDWAVKVLRKK